MTRVSIITALYNNLAATQAFLRSLAETRPPAVCEIILVDDGSTDGTREFLQTLPPGFCRILLNEKNCGFAASNNAGARAATGEVLALLNNDLVLRPGWLEPMLKILESDPHAGIVGNVQRNIRTGRVDHAGIGFDLCGLGMHLGQNLPAFVLAAQRRHRAVTAACCLVGRKTFFTAHGFDENYRNGYEDVDLCLRLDDLGYHQWVAGRSIVLHHISSSPGRHDHEQPNQKRFFERWGERTLAWGRRDWPREYLRRNWRTPWRLNAAKTCDALTRLLGLRRGDSAWAREKRARLFGTP
jgi:GT2 family glycosyltransferase